MSVYNLCLWSGRFYGHKVAFQFPSDRKSLHEKSTRFSKEERYLSSFLQHGFHVLYLNGWSWVFINVWLVSAVAISCNVSSVWLILGHFFSCNAHELFTGLQKQKAILINNVLTSNVGSLRENLKSRSALPKLLENHRPPTPLGINNEQSLSTRVGEHFY